MNIAISGTEFLLMFLLDIALSNLFGRGSDHHRPKELHMCFWSIQSHQKQGGMC
jgi:hypothetical protein